MHGLPDPLLASEGEREVRHTTTDPASLVPLLNGCGIIIFIIICDIIFISSSSSRSTSTIITTTTIIKTIE